MMVCEVSRMDEMEKCRELKKEYEKRAEDRYWKSVAAGKQAADQRAEQMAKTAAREAKKKILALKQALLDEVFQQAKNRLLSLPEDAYVDLLAAYAAQAAKTGRERLLFSPRDRGLFGKRVTLAANDLLRAYGKEAALTMGTETPAIRGGVIVTDGQVDVNCSIEALVEAQRMALTGALAEILFD